MHLPKFCHRSRRFGTTVALAIAIAASVSSGHHPDRAAQPAPRLVLPSTPTPA